ncbi:MAG TPA: hypothetical protein VFX16_37820 [Pseudonocardiaceae bacterium]|nr:hypothetical protein [Pseudonocardiaceae bacterium]
MTSTEVPVSMWCWPGPRAAAGVQTTPSGEYLLSVFLDPMNLVVTVPPFPRASLSTARFLRELAKAALRMAGEIDSVQPSPGRLGGAHRADERGTGRGMES